MDRRTLVFVIGLTIIFYLMRQWFDYGPTTTDQTMIDQPKTLVEYSGEARRLTPLSPRAMDSFQIVRLYEDVELSKFATYSFKRDDIFLLFGWKEHLPKELYLSSDDRRFSSVQRMDLRIHPESIGGPALYSLYGLSKMSIPYIPSDGSYPVHLVYFENDQVFMISGKTVGAKELQLQQKPPKNAFVFFEYAGKITPYAFYEHKSNSLQYFDTLSPFDEYSILTFPEDRDLKLDYSEQEYYVLENQYQQLVFTNLNGALAEINLPFKTEKNPASVVREIEFDRILANRYPQNDQFPQFAYHLPGREKGTKQLVQPKIGGYYPLLRRDIVAFETAAARLNPHFYSLNIFEFIDDPKSNLYTLKRFEKDLIEFELVQGNRRIVKTFSLPKNPEKAPYCLDLSIRVEGDARGLILGLGIPEIELISGNFTPTLKYRITRNQKSKVEKIKPPKDLVTFNHLSPDWICDGNGFFGIIVDPLTKVGNGFATHPVSGELAPTRLSLIDAQYQRFPITKYPGYAIHLPLSPKPGEMKLRVFAGPFDKEILAQVDSTFSNPRTGYNPDYASCQSYHGWFAFISQPFAKFLFIILNFFHTITHSWGFSIILLTLVLRLMLYPLNNWSMRSMAKMQILTPKIASIQEKYKKDPNRVRLETMNIYRKEKVNPFSGCLPMLIQMPFLFGMFDLLKSSFELRGASFIPGWIDNLTAPDVLFSWDYHIPFIGTSFHLLPILLGGLMFVQQKLSSASRSTSIDTDQQKQQRSMGNIMTAVFTVLFYHLPSGLNIYWITSTIFGIFQQKWITKKMKETKKI